MGRYYTGDIDGKFWFAVQSSDAADRFGVVGEQPNILTYYFGEENLGDVETEIANIEESLGEKLKILDDFFAQKNGYTDKELEDIGINRNDLSDYADLGLGRKIRDCIKENGSCAFDAEC